MRVKTSIALPGELLEEQPARMYLDATAKHRRDSKDAAILNRNAERLNREAVDVLEYQHLAE